MACEGRPVRKAQPDHRDPQERQEPQARRGHQARQVPPGPPEDAFTRVTAFGGDFAATNASVSMTAECAAYGPYANGGAAGGSVLYHGLNDMRLGDIVHLVYTAKFSSDTPRTARAPRTCGCSSMGPTTT